MPALRYYLDGLKVTGVSKEEVVIDEVKSYVDR